MSDTPDEQPWPVRPRGPLPAPTSGPLLRASDADRDHVATLLGDAFAQGRLTRDEHADRLSRALAARTVGDLEPLTADLVRQATTARPTGWVYDQQAAPNAFLLSLFGGTKRDGAWRVPARVASLTMFGGTKLDLSDATFTAPAVTLDLLCLFGGVKVQVPDGVHVESHVISLFGGSNAPATANQPGAPTLRVRGLCLFGGVKVRASGSRTPPAPPASAPDLR